MATPLSAGAMLAALRAEGVHVREYRSWRSHNRNHKGSWGGVNGLVIHHTAGVGSGMADFCYDGTSSLPGPLCHAFVSKKATLYLIGHGRANHAGTFARNAHDAVVAESSKHPRPDSSEPIDGNRHYYGIEIENRGDGKDPYPKDQYDQAVRWAAAICRAHGWTADSVIGHKEGTRRKIDPSFSMDGFRADVAERLKRAPGWSPGTSTPPKEDDVALSKDDIEKVAARVWQKDGVVERPDDGVTGNDYWAAKTYLRTTLNTVRKVEAEQRAMHATVRTLAEALGARDELVDVDALVARIEAAIERVTVELNVTEGN